MFQLTLIVTSGWLEFLDQHISLQNLTNLHVFIHNFSIEVLINMKLLHDWFIICELEPKHSPTMYFIFPTSSTPYLISNLPYMIMENLNVTNKSNKRLVIRFNRCPLTILLSFSNFFMVASSTGLLLSLFVLSGEASQISDASVFSVRLEDDR